MSATKEQSVRVTVWRIVDRAGEEIAQGYFPAVSAAWRDLGCTAELHRLEYQAEERIRGKVSKEWRKTPLLPAASVCGE